MIEEEKKRAIVTAQDKFDDLCEKFGNEFAEKIGNLDIERERDRIFDIEEMIGKVIDSSNSVWLETTRDLIQGIDEKEQIRRKKANMQERV